MVIIETLYYIFLGVIIALCLFLPWNKIVEDAGEDYSNDVTSAEEEDEETGDELTDEIIL